MTSRNSVKRKGFTVVELVVVLAVLVILAAVTLPILYNYTDKARIASDEYTVSILNKVTEVYSVQEEIFTGDVFEGIASDEDRMQKLIEEKYLYEIPIPIKEDASFVWDIASQKWIYSL